MSKPKHRRTSTEEDRALWDAVSKTVEPLKGRPGRTPADKEAPKRPVKPQTPSPLRAPVLASRPRPPQLAPLDRRLRSRIGKGTVAIDARIDLHGLTQSAAHQRLRHFLDEGQAAGAKLVLVITGKGRPDGSHTPGEGRGVLRRLVPIWLGSADLRSYVIGYETAGRTHGGDGALYVRIRSQRKSWS